jgi:hypothetical protein
MNFRESLKLVDPNTVNVKVKMYFGGVFCTPNELIEIFGPPNIPKSFKSVYGWMLEHEGHIIKVADFMDKYIPKASTAIRFNIKADDMMASDRFQELLEKELEVVRLPKDSFIMDGF